MHLAAYMGLLVSLLILLAATSYGCISALGGRENGLRMLERAQLAATGLVTFSSLILLRALVARDYSYLYVYEHVDNTLPFSYTLTAFWAGREGSLLFWAEIILLCGVAFLFSGSYKGLAQKTRQYFWVLYLLIQGFFLLLLTSWSNPFVEVGPVPFDGQGLNPLLRNPGMIFHPPLLFLGFAGFTIPAAVALAATLSGEAKSWIKACRNWNILSWIFLTAGIILGGWWSYMELGWGGYWAWDPVENASMIPWFSATAFLHTAIIENRGGALRRTNVFLIVLTFLLCIFSTYLTRSGVINSLHAFGTGGVGFPLMVFMLAGLGIVLLAIFSQPKGQARRLPGFFSRQGLLVVAAWSFMAVGLVVGVGTMWPVISKTWSANPVGLEASFYNRVCLPFLALLVFLFCLCPWLDWKEGIRNRKGLIAVSAIFLVSLGAFWFGGIKLPLANFAAASAVAAMAGIVLLFMFIPGMRRMRESFGAYGIHMGLALMALGIAFSGPYKVERELSLSKGETVRIEEYELKYIDMDSRTSPQMSQVRAKVEVASGGESVGVLYPERRMYRNFNQPFAEVSLIPGFGDELYATLLGFNEDGTVVLKVSVNPLVNWVWIGGTIMCLAGFLLMKRKMRSK